ncbi:MAG: glycosyltransferase family 2 protein [Caulobacteraceae bacterium]
MSALVSAIIPVFERAAEAERAVASALAQEVDGLEVVVVDDGSIEPLRLDASARDSRVRVLRHQRNRGAAAARNTGLQAARGVWTAFLDSDDLWPAGSLARRLHTAVEQKRTSSREPVIWTSGFQYRDPNGRLLKARSPRPGRGPEDFTSGCWFCPGSTALFEREAVLARIGLQDENLLRLEDLDWFLRWSLGGGVTMTAEGVGALVTRSSGTTLGDVNTASVYLQRKYVDLAPGLRRRLRAYLALETARAAFLEKHFGRGTIAIAESLILKPRAQLHLDRFWSDL